MVRLDPPVTAARAVPATGTAAVAGRRERKKLATRAAVREAALRLALRNGVENVTVEQITDEADIAVRTFFNYFSSKEEAVVAAAAAGAEALIAEFRARPGTESVLRALREAVLAIVDQGDAASRDYIRALQLIRRTPSLVPHQLAVMAAQEKALADAIAERIQPGTASRDQGRPIPSGIYPELCAATALTALRVVMGRWLERADGPDDTPPMAILCDEIDEAIAELAAGLDRPGTADAGDPANAL
ncbi:transcriptional regulator, TetR family [Streptosporangium subroseum]|uniref:Transcriptional regulator, TetR family n=1 Tax=Streptosporangium subroseum TaxID=106412 RepID=A0A239KZK5_9ACTN|nr:TetR family transcriptional regulator [Streptosporangium subroseum]SNT22714.1 transcriptional regulator, TetR family [Streptosporangium subroseum]